MAYSAPVVATWLFYLPMWGIVPSLYVKYFGLELTAVATVALLVRIFDGITDPTIGYLSDCHRTNNGSRKPWVALGGLGSLIACYYLFLPPEQVTANYFLFWSLVYFLALTLSEIPHFAWGAELTMDYNSRARVYSIRNMAGMLGCIIFYALPLLPLYESSEYTPEILHDALYLGATLTLCGLVWALVKAPGGVFVKPTDESDNLKLLLQSLVHNKPLLIYYSGYSCIGLSIGMWSGLLFIYADSYLGIGDRLAIIFTIATIIAALSSPLWLKLIERYSKHQAWALGAGCFAVHLLCISFIEVGASWWWLLLLTTVAYIGFSGHNIASLSTLGDIIDYGQLTYHRNRTATYIAFNNMLYKWGLGLGAGISLGIAGLFGFNPAIESNSGHAIVGLQLGHIYLPLLFSAVGVAFILATPITRRRHRIIEQRLATRVVRSTETKSTVYKLGG